MKKFILLMLLSMNANALELSVGLGVLADKLYDKGENKILGRAKLSQRFGGDDTAIEVYVEHISVLLYVDPHNGLNIVGANVVLKF